VVLYKALTGALTLDPSEIFHLQDSLYPNGNVMIRYTNHPFVHQTTYAKHLIIRRATCDVWIVRRVVGG